MARKYCPVCYFEFQEKVGLKPNGKQRPMDWEDNRQENKPEFACTKRGHHSKGPGLSVRDLNKLSEFRQLDL